MNRTIESRLRTAGERQGWWQSPGILVALSGGSDSVALLMLLKKYYAGRIVAAHLEHGIRGTSSLADAVFVSELCARFGVRLLAKHGDVPANARLGESTEMAARRIRYEFFDEALRSESMRFVAIGHTLDDNVETQMFNILRGTGLSGLTGIPETRDGIVRPLIDFRREELREMLRSENIPWRDDETNDESLYTRNKIRLELLPWLRAHINANVDDALLRLGTIAADAQKIIDEETRRILENVAVEAGRVPAGAVAAWNARLAETFPQEDLAYAIREQGERLALPALGMRRTKELCRLLTVARGWRFQWAGDMEVRRVGKNILWLHCPR